MNKTEFYMLLGCLLAFSTPAVTAAQSAGPRSVSDPVGNVFLGGRYIEFGIGNSGSSGVIAGRPTPYGFFGRLGTRGAPGFVGDADGFGNGLDLRIDYFLPGTPAEGWGMAIGNTTDLNRDGSTGMPNSTFVNASAGDLLRTLGVTIWTTCASNTIFPSTPTPRPSATRSRWRMPARPLGTTWRTCAASTRTTPRTSAALTAR